MVLQWCMRILEILYKERQAHMVIEIIPAMGSANEKRRYVEMSFLIGGANTLNIARIMRQFMAQKLQI